MGIILNILYTEEEYENNNDDIIIDIQRDDIYDTTDYRDYCHIQFKETIPKNNGIDFLNMA